MIYEHWSDYPLDRWRWPNFSPQEMACRGTGRLLIHEPSMDALQRLRSRLRKPFTVNSAYRSPEHNRHVGGAKHSLHMQGIAFDISMANHDPAAFIAAAEEEGFTGIGTYPANGFIHIDTGEPRRWGKPFPARAATPVFAPERRQPETLREDPEAGAAAGAGAAGAVAVAIDALPAAGGLLGELAPVAQVVAITAAALLIGWLIWKRSRR